MTLKPFGILLLALPLTAATVRIIQTNSAGDDVSIIDPATNKVIGRITGIEVNHGAAVAPDGSKYYISNEANSTLEIVDGKTLKGSRRLDDKAIHAAFSRTSSCCVTANSLPV